MSSVCNVHLVLLLMSYLLNNLQRSSPYMVLLRVAQSSSRSHSRLSCRIIASKPSVLHRNLHQTKIMPKRQRAPDDAHDDAPLAKTQRKKKPDESEVVKHQENVLRHPSVQRAKEIDAHPPMTELDELVKKQKTDQPVRNVLHWFRSKDLRIEDNKGLHAASQKAKEGKGVLITAYLWSPRDLEWHGTSPARSDFILENLRIMQKQLKERNIPMVILPAPDRRDKSVVFMDFVKKNDISHIYGNLEYEVDELRRDINVVKLAQKEQGLSFHVLHDQTVVAPGTMTNKGGGLHKVFTPYHGAWLDLIGKKPELLDLVDAPAANDETAITNYKHLFDSPIPELPPNKQFASSEERDRIRSLFPPGHTAGIDRLNKFLTTKVFNYARDRSFPGKDPSSRLSAYFSAGVISPREAVAAAKKANKGKPFGAAGDAGIASWVREIVFREYYRQITVIVPHNAMNLPHNLKFHFVKFEEDYEAEKKWYEGKTGVPFVDAGMRQLNTEAYMHNRARMNVSSYLRMNLLIDYRKGERYFAEHLIDWDMSNNTEGWEPSFTVFNPVVQAEKCDHDGDYIRQWVPELRNVKGKAIFAPWERLSKAEFDKLGYPRPHVDFRESKERALARYKQGMADANAHVGDD